jgi:hypothetical protein
MAQDFLRDRGAPWEFDPGPPPGTRWAELFGGTPNYRGLGREISGRDEFRWHFGPMFFRGRLAPGGARVLVIGQEGAQDESLGHRSFVGGSGARMQNFVRHLGITRSYVFLNTFVYPIFGQYNGAGLLWLAQNVASPIVQHRHAILNHLAELTDLHLIVAVGKAAKESIHTWVQSRGGACPSRAHDVSECDASVISPRTRIVGVVHPGAGGQGGSTTDIVADFKRALSKVDEWSAQDAAWLPVDPGGTRGTPETFRYRSAPIPFHDLPYGVCWRVGQGGTSSNRKDSQRGIQVFSEAGEYGATIRYDSSARGSRDGYDQRPGDLPYEPPKISFTEFDPGPGEPFARLMMGGEPGLAWPDFTALGAPAHASLGRGPIYRGRPGEARVLVLADQESHDDLFTFRAMTGEGGQHFQAFLRAMGIDRHYAIVRVLPVDTLGLPADRINAILDDPQIVKLYRAIVERIVTASGTSIVLTVGPHAARLRAAVVAASLPVVQLSSWAGSATIADWNRALQEIRAIPYDKDLTSPSFVYDGTRTQIARIDLPFGTLRWQGTSGDRAVRAAAAASAPNYYKILMPGWAFDLSPAPLTESEQAALDAAPETERDPLPD